MQDSASGTRLRAALAVFALLAQLPAPASGDEPGAPASLDESAESPPAPGDALRIEGCRGLAESALRQLQVTLALGEPDRLWSAPRGGDIHRSVSLAALGASLAGGARIDRSAAQSIAESVLDAYARAGRLGTRVDVELEAEPGADAPDASGSGLRLLIEEAQPGFDLERVARAEGAPARVSEIAFRGVSGTWISTDELRALPLALARIPGGYVGVRPGLPTLHRSASDLERPSDLPVSVYASALQELLDAVSQAYRDRGAPGTRVHIARSALRSTLGSSSTGVLEIQVSEP